MRRTERLIFRNSREQLQYYMFLVLVRAYIHSLPTQIHSFLKLKTKLLMTHAWPKIVIRQKLRQLQTCEMGALKYYTSKISVATD